MNQLLIMSTLWYNEAVYAELPPAEARYQLAHIHESRAKDINISHFVCLTIAVVAIALRFLSRRISRTALKMDDWMIVAALVCSRPAVVSESIDSVSTDFRTWVHHFGTTMYHEIWRRSPCHLTQGPCQICSGRAPSISMQEQMPMYHRRRRAYLQQKSSTLPPLPPSKSVPSFCSRASFRVGASVSYCIRSARS